MIVGIDIISVSILKYFIYWAAEFISEAMAAAEARKAPAASGWFWQVIKQEAILS